MKRTHILPLLVMAIGAAAFAIACYAFFLEDAFMHLRYAINTVNTGVWSVWNQGELPVSGSSSPLWLALLTLGYKCGIHPYLFSKLLAAFAALIFLFDLHTFYIRSTVSRGIHAYPILFAVSLFSLVPIQFYAVSGMETIFFCMILARMLFTSSKRSFSMIWAPAMIFIRPEGAVFVFLITMVRFWPEAWRIGSLRLPLGSSFWLDVRRIVFLGLPSLVLFVLYLTWHAHYFGYPFPNTYYAKADLPFHEGLIYGIRTILKFGADYYFVVIFASLFLVNTRMNREDVSIFVLSLFLLTYLLRIGGDNAAVFPYHRHLVPMVGFLWVYAVIGVDWVASRTRAPRTFMLCLLMALVMSHLVSEFQAEGSPLRYWRQHAKALLKLPDVSHARAETETLTIERILDAMPANSTMAIFRAGRIPATFIHHRFLDMGGLHDAHIAHKGKRQYGAVDTKYDANYVLSCMPDVIELPIQSMYINNRTVKKSVSHWRDQVDDSLKNPLLTERYAFIPTTEWAVFVNTNALSCLPLDMQRRAKHFNYLSLLGE